MYQSTPGTVANMMQQETSLPATEFDMTATLVIDCSDPTNTDGPEIASLYGECIFSAYTEADLDLTMEVQAAAEAAIFPARSHSSFILRSEQHASPNLETSLYISKWRFQAPLRQLTSLPCQFQDSCDACCMLCFAK